MPSLVGVGAAELAKLALGEKLNKQQISRIDRLTVTVRPQRDPLSLRDALRIKLPHKSVVALGLNTIATLWLPQDFSGNVFAVHPKNVSDPELDETASVQALLATGEVQLIIFSQTPQVGWEVGPLTDYLPRPNVRA